MTRSIFARVDLKTGEVKVLINEISKPYFNNDFFHLSLLNEGDRFTPVVGENGSRAFLIITTARERSEECDYFRELDGGGRWLRLIPWTHRIIHSRADGQDEGADVPRRCPGVNKARIDGNGQVEVLTPEQATHEAYFSKSGRYFVDNYSRGWICVNPGACCGITRER